MTVFWTSWANLNIWNQFHLFVNVGTGKPSYMWLTFYFYWTMLLYVIGLKDQEYPIYTNLDVINIRDKCYKFSSRRMDFHRCFKKLKVGSFCVQFDFLGYCTSRNLDRLRKQFITIKCIHISTYTIMQNERSRDGIQLPFSQTGMMKTSCCQTGVLKHPAWLNGQCVCVRARTPTPTWILQPHLSKVTEKQPAVRGNAGSYPQVTRGSKPSKLPKSQLEAESLVSMTMGTVQVTAKASLNRKQGRCGDLTVA